MSEIWGRFYHCFLCWTRLPAQSSPVNCDLPPIGEQIDDDETIKQANTGGSALPSYQRNHEDKNEDETALAALKLLRIPTPPGFPLSWPTVVPLATSIDMAITNIKHAG